MTIIDVLHNIAEILKISTAIMKDYSPYILLFLLIDFVLSMAKKISLRVAFAFIVLTLSGYHFDFKVPTNMNDLLGNSNTEIVQQLTGVLDQGLEDL